MYKRPKTIKQQLEGAEGKTSSSLPSKTSSQAQPPSAVESSDLPFPNQSILFEELPMSTEIWEALYVSPLPNSPTLSEWQQELREIEQECEKDVWESCPYD